MLDKIYDFMDWLYEHTGHSEFVVIVLTYLITYLIVGVPIMLLVLWAITS